MRITGSTDSPWFMEPTVMNMMTAMVAEMILVFVKDHIPPPVRSRDEYICWNLSAVFNTSPIKPKMNMKVVITNMNILGRDENKPGLPLGK
jgi:hypothetical protein